MEEKSKRSRKTTNPSKIQSDDVEKCNEKNLKIDPKEKNEDSPTKEEASQEKPTAIENSALEHIVKPLQPVNSEQSNGEENSNKTTVEAQPSKDFEATDANFSTDTHKSSMFNEDSLQNATIVKKPVVEETLEPIEPANIDQGNSPENADKKLGQLQEATNAEVHEADVNPKQEKSISQTTVEAKEAHSEDTLSPKGLKILPMVIPYEPLLPSAEDCSQAGNWQIGTLSPVESITVFDFLPANKRQFPNEFITLSVPTVTGTAPFYAVATDDAALQGWFNHMLDEPLSPVDTRFDLQTLASVYEDDVETKPKSRRGRKPNAAKAAEARTNTARRSSSKSMPPPNISEAYVPYNNPLIVDHTPKVIVESVNPSFVLPKRYYSNQDDRLYTPKVIVESVDPSFVLPKRYNWKQDDRECHKTDNEAKLMPPPPNPTYESMKDQQNRFPFFGDCSAKSEPQQTHCASPMLQESTQPSNIPKFKVLVNCRGQMKPIYLTAAELKNVREMRPLKMLEQKPPPPISSVLQLLRAKRRDLQQTQRAVQEKPKVSIEAIQHPTTNKPSGQQILKSIHILRQKSNKKNYKPSVSSTKDATTCSAATQDTTNDTINLGRTTRSMSKSMQKNETQSSLTSDFEHAAETSVNTNSNDVNLFQNIEPTRKMENVNIPILPSVASSSTLLNLESPPNSCNRFREVTTVSNIANDYKVSENPESESSTPLKEAPGFVRKLLSSNLTLTDNNMDFSNNSSSDETNRTHNKILELTENNSSNFSATNLDEFSGSGFNNSFNNDAANKSKFASEDSGTANASNSSQNENICSENVENIADIIADFEVLLDDDCKSFKFGTIEEIEEFIKGTTTSEASQHSNNVSHNKTALETAENVSAVSPKETSISATAYNEVVSNSNNYETQKDNAESGSFSLHASTTTLTESKYMEGFSNNYKVLDNSNKDEILENVERSIKDTTQSDAAQSLESNNKTLSLDVSPLAETKQIEGFSKYNQVFEKSHNYKTLEHTTPAGASWNSDSNYDTALEAAERTSLGWDILTECASTTFLPEGCSNYNEVLENCNDYNALENIDEYIKEITKSETSQNSNSNNVSNNKTAPKTDEHSSRSLGNSSTSSSETKHTKTFPNYYELFDNFNNYNILEDIEGYTKYTTALNAFQSSDSKNVSAQKTAEHGSVNFGGFTELARKASLPESKFIESFCSYNETFDNSNKSETLEDIERYVKDTTSADASRNSVTNSTQEPATKSSLGLDASTESGTFLFSEKSLVEILKSPKNESKNENERIKIPENVNTSTNPYESQQTIQAETLVAAKNSRTTITNSSSISANSGNSSRKSKNLPKHVSLQSSTLRPPHVVSTFSDNSSDSRVITRGRFKTNIDNILRQETFKKETLKSSRKLRHSTKSFTESDSENTTDDEIEAIGHVLMADEMKQAESLHMSKENRGHVDTAPKSASVAESKKVRNLRKRRKKEPQSPVRVETKKVETTQVYKSKRRKCKDRTLGAT